MESRKEFSARFADKLETTGWGNLFERDGICLNAPYNPVGQILEHDLSGSIGDHCIEGEYTGSNRLRLAIERSGDARWMTWEQIERLGHTINPIVARPVELEHWKFAEERPIFNDNGEPALDGDGNPLFEEFRLSSPKLSSFTVFNGWDITGLESDTVQEKSDKTEVFNDLVKSLGFEFVYNKEGECSFVKQGDKSSVDLGEPFCVIGEALIEKLGVSFNHELCARLTGALLQSSLPRHEKCLSLIGADGYYVDTFPNAGPQVEFIRQDHNAIYRAARDADKVIAWALNPELRQDIEKDIRFLHSPKQNVNGQGESLANLKGLNVKPELVDHLKDIEKSFAIETSIKSGLMLVMDQEKLAGIFEMRHRGFEAVKEEGGIDNMLAFEKVFSDAGESEVLKNNIDEIIYQFDFIRKDGGVAYKLKNEELGWEINNNGVPNDDAHRRFSDHLESLHKHADQTRDPAFFQRIELMKDLVVDYENLQREVLGIKRELGQTKEAGVELAL